MKKFFISCYLFFGSCLPMLAPNRYVSISEEDKRSLKQGLSEDLKLIKIERYISLSGHLLEKITFNLDLIDRYSQKFAFDPEKIHRLLLIKFLQIFPEYKLEKEVIKVDRFACLEIYSIIQP